MPAKRNTSPNESSTTANIGFGRFRKNDDVRWQPNKPGFTGKTPVSVMILGNKREVTTWREVLQETLESVRESVPDAFDGIVEQFPRLLSSEAGRFRNPRPLVDDLHFETNLSAESIARYCQQIIMAAGYSSTDWSVETR